MTIPTTHVGSLPRGLKLSSLLISKDKGDDFDQVEFEATVQLAINEAVQRQVDSGVTIVSDGELGKIGYSTYIQEQIGRAHV